MDTTSNNLGEKHKIYNECVAAGKIYQTPVISHKIEGDDIVNLMRVDLACEQKDIHFLLELLKGEDMLLISRALKLSTWFITENDYAHIVHPDYLNSQLFPEMMTKAKHKLTKHIRHFLRDEMRVEAFYKNEKNIQNALKWLPNCSLNFIECEAKKHTNDITLKLFKRLCKKSVDIFDVLMINSENKQERLQASLFILFKNCDKYLDIMENVNKYEIPQLGVTGTTFVMNHRRSRAINNLNKYIISFDIPTFVKHLKRDEVKGILYKLIGYNAKDRYDFYSIFNYNAFKNIKFFIERMPSEERYKFVKAVFIDKVHKNKNNGVYDQKEIENMTKIYNEIECKEYVWYQFFPFDIAFPELKNRIRNETSVEEKYSILSVIVKCARSNLQHIHNLLQYYYDVHLNDKRDNKDSFIKEILSQIDIYKFDKKSWKILNDIFESMNVYSDDSTDILPDEIIEAIIIYKVINDEHVSEAVQKQFTFNTLKTYENKLNFIDKEKLFNFLYNYMSLKLKFHVDNENDFKVQIDVVLNILYLLKDWKKEILDFPNVLDMIRECIKIKKQYSWNSDLSKLYNVKKAWKRHMFEESLILHPSKEVCINALKHDPELFTRYKSEVEAIFFNDKLDLNHLFRKIRIFYSLTLAKDWSSLCLNRLENTKEHKALIRSICTVLPPKELLDFLKKYIPLEAKINWNDIDGSIVSLQRNIAKNMHLARPHPYPDTVLAYAKGDYLQYALPSLLAIFFNLSPVKSREHIPKLLNGPVSLQKHGLRFAVIKLKIDEVREIFSNIWKTTKNVSVRAVIFKSTYDILCKEKNENKIKLYWNLLELFIDNLTFKEDKNIYKLLHNVENVPVSVRSNYIMKSYNFLKTLLPEADDSERENYERSIEYVFSCTRDIMQYMCPVFMSTTLLEMMEKIEPKGDTEQMYYYQSEMVPILSVYLLATKDENTQLERYTKVMIPFLQRCFNNWGRKFYKRNFTDLLCRFRFDLDEYVMKNDMIIPATMFSYLLSEMEKALPVAENYILLTQWKLTTAFTKILLNTERTDWESMCVTAAPSFGIIALQYLKNDVETYFPAIYELFSKALNTVMEQLVHKNANVIMLKNIVSRDFTPAYLVALELCPENEGEELRKLIRENPSPEIKMHYYCKFKNLQDECE